MMIIPKKGYRVCLTCGKVLTKHQMDIMKNHTGKNSCPYCYTGEKEDTGVNKLTEYQAEMYFKLLGDKGQETRFMETPEITEKYNKLLEMYGIPKDLWF